MGSNVFFEASKSLLMGSNAFLEASKSFLMASDAFLEASRATDTAMTSPVGAAILNEIDSLAPLEKKMRFVVTPRGGRSLSQ